MRARVCGGCASRTCGEAAVESGHRQDKLAILTLVRCHKWVEALEEPGLLRRVSDGGLLVAFEFIRLNALALGEDVVTVLVDSRHRVQVRRQAFLRQAQGTDCREAAGEA